MVVIGWVGLGRARVPIGTAKIRAAKDMRTGERYVAARMVVYEGFCVVVVMWG